MYARNHISHIAQRLLTGALLLVSAPIRAEEVKVNSATEHNRYRFDRFFIGSEPFRYNADCIMKDSEGDLYVCTNNGLYIFNGYSFSKLNQDSHADFSNKVYAAIDLGDRKIAVGTLDKGLFVYNKVNGAFIRVEPEGKMHKPLAVRALFDDSFGSIWVGCTSGIILRYRKQDLLGADSSIPLKAAFYQSTQKSDINAFGMWHNSLLVGMNDSSVYEVVQGSAQIYLRQYLTLQPGVRSVFKLHVNNGSLWVGTDNGLFIFDAEKDRHRSKHLLPGTIVRGTDSRKPDIVWVGTREDGLYRIVRSGNQYRVLQLTSNVHEKRSLNSSSILSILIDDNANLWVGTWFGGLTRTRLNPPPYKEIYNLNNENIIQKNITWCAARGRNGRYFVGNHANGINIYDGGSTFSTALVSPQLFSISSLLALDSLNLLAVGTWGKGLKLLNQQTLQELPSHTRSLAALNRSRIYSISNDSLANLWIGSYESGLYRYSLRERRLEAISFDPVNRQGGSRPTDVRDIYIEGRTVWVGSIHSGLYKLLLDRDGRVQQSIRFPFVAGAVPSGITGIYRFDNTITCTTESGIVRVTSGDSLQPILPELRGKLCTDLKTDWNGNLWVATYEGLYRYSRSNATLTHFNKTISYYQILPDKQRRTLLLCSNNGLYELNPDRMLQRPPSVGLALANLRIADHPVQPGTRYKGRVIISQNIRYLDTLLLPHFGSTFAITLQVKDLASNPNLSIEYMLEGFDSGWQRRDGPATIVSYANLPAGEYRILARVLGPDMLPASAMRKLTIIRQAPWWFSTTAQLIYLLILAATALLIVLQSKKYLRIRNELKLEKLSKEKEEELHNQKLSFFTNISHDLKTPLTLIASPLKELIRNPTGYDVVDQTLKSIFRNTLLLERLINQIFDFRKIEKAGMEVNLHRIDVPHFIHNTIEQFSEAAKRKEIDLLMDAAPDTLCWPLDPYMFESVAYNLIANSLKFTKRYGQISVAIYLTKDRLKLQFTDTGIGIPADEVPFIFDRFYQARNGVRQGTGIGLALVKKYVEVHKGEIYATSEPGKVTTFTLLFAARNDVDMQALPEYKSDAVEDISPRNTTSISHHHCRVLIVDDNHDMLEYLSRILSPTYTVITALNGADALDIARRKSPDLIISDVMMEEMDGYELCRRIKKNLSTSHIPVILLTAKSGTISRIRSIETGADAFIEKPFNVKLLVTQAAELIRHRELLKAKYALLDSGHSDISPGPVDERFLREVIQVVERHILESQLTVSTIATEVRISHDQLYRKIKSLSGLSINQFIRVTRLKKSVSLLEKGNLTVSEVAYKVGFSSPSYFTKCFKEEFGISPTDLVERIGRKKRR